MKIWGVFSMKNVKDIETFLKKIAKIPIVWWKIQWSYNVVFFYIKDFW